MTRRCRRAYDQTARSFSSNQAHRAGEGEARSAFAPDKQHFLKERMRCPNRVGLFCAAVIELEFKSHELFDRA